MSDHPEISHLDREQRIRNIAYTIWEEEGRPDGCAEAHWLRACELVDAEAVGPGSMELASEVLAEEVAAPEWLKKVEPQAAPVAESPRSMADVARKVAGRAA